MCIRDRSKLWARRSDRSFPDGRADERRRFARCVDDRHRALIVSVKALADGSWSRSRVDAGVQIAVGLGSIGWAASNTGDFEGGPGSDNDGFGLRITGG